MAHTVTFIPGTAPGPSSRRPPAASSRPPASSPRVGPPRGGRRRVRALGQPVPRRDARLHPPQRRRHQGPDDHARRLGLPLGQRPAAQGARPLRLHPALQGLRGRAHALPRDGHRHRPREHRGPVRRHRVREGHARGRRAARRPRASSAPRSARTPASRSSRSPCSARSRIVRAAFEYARGQRAAQGDRGPQGQHHEVLRRPVPRGGAQGRRGLPGHRVRGPDHRQPVQPARVAAGGVRRRSCCPTSTATSCPTWARA